MKDDPSKKFSEEYVIRKETEWDNLDLSNAEVGDIPGATEDIQDAIGSILADTTTINFTYTDATPEIKADVIQAGLDHGSIGGLSDNDHPQYLLVANIDDTPVNGETSAPISSNWAFDHEAASDPHTGYVLESLVNAKGDILVATADNTITRLAVGSDDQVLTAASGEATGLKWAAGGSGSGTVIISTFNARLTLTTAVPITTSDVTGATTIYLTPYNGKQIALYNGSAWEYHNLTEISIAVPATTNTMYDIFVYDSSGLTLEAVAWTNDTTRATAIVLQDGVYVKNGATSRRYVGSFRTTGVSGQTEDSAQKRILFNYYNRVKRKLKRVDTTNTWTYSTAAYHQANASTSNQVEVVTGVAEDEVRITVLGNAANDTGTGRNVVVGVGVDSTTANSADIYSYETIFNTAAKAVWAHYAAIPAVGYHYYAWLEYGAGADTQTWRGDLGIPDLIQTGMVGECWA